MWSRTSPVRPEQKQPRSSLQVTDFGVQSFYWTTKDTASCSNRSIVWPWWWQNTILCCFIWNLFLQSVTSNLSAVAPLPICHHRCPEHVPSIWRGDQWAVTRTDGKVLNNFNVDERWSTNVQKDDVLCSLNIICSWVWTKHWKYRFWCCFFYIVNLVLMFEVQQHTLISLVILLSTHKNTSLQLFKWHKVILY